MYIQKSHFGHVMGGCIGTFHNNEIALILNEVTLILITMNWSSNKNNINHGSGGGTSRGLLEYNNYHNYCNNHNDYGPKEVARQEAYERQLQQQAEHERQLQVSKLSKWQK